MDNKKLEKLHSLIKHLKKAHNPQAIFNITTTLLPEMLNAKYCSLFIRNPASGELELKAHNHPDIGDNPFISVGKNKESIMNLALEKKRSLLIRDIEKETGQTKKNKYKSGTCMCALIRNDKKIIGVINFADKISNDFTKEDLLVVSIISELIGTYLSQFDINNFI